MLKMKVRLIDVDSKIPNFALMKISSFHKKKGDDVGWYEHLFDYDDTDILYISKIFKFSKDVQYLPINAKIIKGGTGYDIQNKLPEEIENILDLDYSLYPKCNYSILFMSRGCIRNCKFCVVPKKEGKIKQVIPVNLNPNGKWIMLLDNNFFACKEWRENIGILKQYNQPVDFNQGIDLRILDEEQCKALATLKIKSIHCAWDNYKDKEIILPKLEMLCKYVKPYKITCYVLVGYESKYITDQDLERVLVLDKMGIDPFAMGYINFDDPQYQKSQEVKDFCRWVNMKACFKSCTFEEYKGRK
ncbi:MAG: putative radical SAM domain protein [Podoviridae sp. ctcf755]|nr:MAG: putative radical SAM domain protein [Podoviridae sp. ctcf755]